MKTQPNMWHLIHLGHELTDMAFRLNSLAAQLKYGVVDCRLFDTLSEQVKVFDKRLDRAFDFSRPS
jgi:hypothetical protein